MLLISIRLPLTSVTKLDDLDGLAIVNDDMKDPQGSGDAESM